MLAAAEYSRAGQWVALDVRELLTDLMGQSTEVKQ